MKIIAAIRPATTRRMCQFPSGNQPFIDVGANRMVARFGTRARGPACCLINVTNAYVFSPSGYHEIASIPPVNNPYYGHRHPQRTMPERKMLRGRRKILSRSAGNRGGAAIRPRHIPQVQRPRTLLEGQGSQVILAMNRGTCGDWPAGCSH
jgi:hypothetical protein